LKARLVLTLAPTKCVKNWFSKFAFLKFGLYRYAEGRIPPEPFPAEPPEPIDRPEAEAELVQKNIMRE
jgi:hypothetical protein